MPQGIFLYFPACPVRRDNFYEYYSIPFLVVIDKEGKLAARNVRGEQVREAILKIRQ